MSRARDIADFNPSLFTTAEQQAIVRAGPGSGTMDVGSGTIDVSAGTLTTSTAQKTAILAGGNFPSGMIVNAKLIANSTKTTIASTSNSDDELIAWGNYTKLFSGTDLFMQFNIFMWDSTTQWTGNIGVKYGSGSTFWAQSYPYEDVSKGNQMAIYAKISGHSTTGSQGISIRYGNPTSNTRPASIINPNSAEDSRLNNLGQSVGIIYEVNT